MSSLWRYIKKAIKMPPKKVMRKGIEFVSQRMRDCYKRSMDKRRYTYCLAEKQLVPVIYQNIVKATLPENYLMVAELNRQHCFDLLGSGWIKQNAIDWQKDFKSGYRWSEDVWYKDIKHGTVHGTDIKVPWELSRMQHLVLYAYAFCELGAENGAEYVREFQDEILDFITKNPPRFGVCWRCTMDVGIRIANWLMSYDLFVSFGAVFDEEFSRVFARSVYDHAYHIINNLEYSPELTSNHYLSDIGGLLFAAMHLASEPETDAWLAFAIQELVSEMEREFHEDGSNFEASVSYHCLSTEIMLHCACLCQHITVERRQKLKGYQKSLVKKGPKLKALEEQAFSLDTEYIFPEWFFKRLQRALHFVEVCSDDGLIQQIGDVDSGRFLKLAPVFTVHTGNDLKKKYMNLQNVSLDLQGLYLDEDLQNNYHLTQVLDVLQRKDNAFADNVEMALVRESGLYFFDKNNLVENLHCRNIEESFKGIEGNIPKEYTVQRYEFSLPEGYRQNLETVAYSGMGIYSFRSAHFHMLVRCGEVGQNGNGGHSHNDQLSLTLNVGGEDIIADAGSYLYTPAPDMRNKFRGTAMHFTPQPIAGTEQNEWEAGQLGLFSIKKDRTKAEVLYAGCDGMIMSHVGFGTPVYRVVKLESQGIVVEDYGDKLKRWQHPTLHSNGYGKLQTKI